MFGIHKYRKILVRKYRAILTEIMFILTSWTKVSVLLLILASHGNVCDGNVNMNGLNLLGFTSMFYTPVGPGRIDGLMASDGTRHRFTIYWIEPDVYHDNTFFLGYSEFIFTKEKVTYWVQGASHPATFNLSDVNSVSLLPQDVSTESVARSALAIANLAHSEPKSGSVPLVVGTFFHQSRGLSDYYYELPSKEASGDSLSDDTNVSDVQILNNLPYGRKYSKETLDNGSLVWRAQRVLSGPPVATITVKPVRYVQMDDANEVFDSNTLGCWMLIPGPYRAYWSFYQVYSKVKDGADNASRSRALYEKVETYIAKNKVPDRIDLAFNQLLFKTSLLTGDIDRVSRSAHTIVATLCQDSSVNSYQELLELARIDVQIRKLFPQQADELIRPLVDLMIRHMDDDAPGNLERSMPTIHSNRWFAFGKLLAEEIHVQRPVNKDDTDSLAARIEATRLATELPPYDPCQEGESVMQYMAQLDANPPKGELTLDDLRDILLKGLAKPFADAQMDFQPELIEDIIHSIRLIAGEGPFRGDQDKLIASINKFSGLYLVVFQYQEPIDTVLATFLALSFCDTSTEEDHDELFSQICTLCAEFQSLTNTMIAERGLSELVTLDDTERLFTRYKERFCQYIDDPLWPPFKFPLTGHEQTQLINKLKPRFDQLDSIFEEMALKVKYGGVSDELKTKTRREIASVIQQLLPQSAFLRNPPYPNVSCRFRGAGHGFTAVIKGQLYREGARPREKFKAMKYFHMGHRLENIVIRERKLATAKEQERIRN